MRDLPELAEVGRGIGRVSMISEFQILVNQHVNIASLRQHANPPINCTQFTDTKGHLTNASLAPDTGE